MNFRICKVVVLNEDVFMDWWRAARGSWMGES